MQGMSNRNQTASLESIPQLEKVGKIKEDLVIKKKDLCLQLINLIQVDLDAESKVKMLQKQLREKDQQIEELNRKVEEFEFSFYQCKNWFNQGKQEWKKVENLNFF